MGHLPGKLGQVRAAFKCFDPLTIPWRAALARYARPPVVGARVAPDRRKDRRGAALARRGQMMRAIDQTPTWVLPIE